MESEGRTPRSSKRLSSNVIETEGGKTVGGEKDIGFVGGVSLLINNITGPGLVSIPVLFQQAGYITPIVIMLLIMALSSIASLMLCSAMSRMPGNNRFQGRSEFSSLAQFLLPRWAYIITMICVVISLMSVLISSIVLSAQTMDETLLAIFKKTWAFEFYPHFGPKEILIASDDTSPFGNSFVLSVGYGIVLLLTVPLGYFNLDDNVIVQKGAILFMIIIFIEWFVNFFMVGLDFSRVPAAAANQTQVLGNLIFNYGFVITVPSWINEKKEGVSIGKSIWTATAIATSFYISIGLLGAWAFDFASGQQLLNVIVLHSTGPLRLISMIFVYLFPAVALLSSIPVFSIIIRYNLTDNGFVTKRAVANFWAVIFPWVLGIVFYTGAGVFDVINWTSLFVNGFVNFIVPIILYIIANKKVTPAPKSLNDDVTVDENGDRRLRSISDSFEGEASALLGKRTDDTEYFKALPEWKWLHPNAAAYGIIVVFTIALLTVIIISFIEI